MLLQSQHLDIENIPIGLAITLTQRLLFLMQEMQQRGIITQQKDWDLRINDLLSGINKIIDAIGRMRNMNSDAHGAGVGRIAIKEREARLIAASAVMVSEYLLSIYQKDRE